jgi:hypothetical protein
MRARSTTVLLLATLLLGGCAADDQGADTPKPKATHQKDSAKPDKPKKTKATPPPKPKYPARLFANCEAFNSRWPNGVARPGAKDATSGTPVTSFLVNKQVYQYATAQNSGLDGDGDGVICESG